MMWWTEISPTLVGSEMKRNCNKINNTHENTEGDIKPDALINNAANKTPARADDNLQSASEGKQNTRSSRKQHNDRRMAEQIRKKLMDIDRSQLSDKQLSSLNWAKGILDKNATKISENNTPERKDSSLDISLNGKSSDRDSSSTSTALNISPSSNELGKMDSSITTSSPSSEEKMYMSKSLCPKRNIRASKIKYDEYRKAKTVFLRLINVDRTKLNEKQLSSLHWAKGIIDEKHTKDGKKSNDDNYLFRSNQEINEEPIDNVLNVNLTAATAGSASRHQRPSKKKYRKAWRIMKNYMDADRAELSDQQLSSLQWAEGIIDAKNSNNEDINQEIGEKSLANISSEMQDDCKRAWEIIAAFIDDNNEDEISDELLSSLNWAKGIIVGKKATNTNYSPQNYQMQEIKLNSPDKLQSSELLETDSNNEIPLQYPIHERKRKHCNNSIETTPYKIAKSDESTTLNETEESTVMAIINRNEDDGKISRNQWPLVESALCLLFNEILNEMPGKPPKCRDAGWFQGTVKLIAFHDIRSIILYKAALSRIPEVWSGCKLEMVSQDNIPTRAKAYSWIPNATTDEEVLNTLKISNPALPVHKWEIVNSNQLAGTRRKILLILSLDSMPILAKTNGIIAYGFGQITLIPYGQTRFDVCRNVTCGELSQSGELHEEHALDGEDNTL